MSEVNEWISECNDGCVDGWTNDINKWMECTKEMNERMKEWINEINERMNEVSE